MYRLLSVLLAVGAVLGFAAGFQQSHERWHDRHEAFERHVAQLCVDAARGAGTGRDPTPPSAPSP